MLAGGLPLLQLTATRSTLSLAASFCVAQRKVRLP
jgi:hypothetical protein